MAALYRDNQESDGILVEINMDNGGYYEGFIKDICKNEGVIHFPYRLTRDEKYPFSRMRFPPMEATKESELQKNMIAEVLVARGGTHHLGWFKCCINTLRSAFCEFKCLDNTDNVDFAKITHVRKPNTNPPISMDMFHVHNITVPEELREFANYENVRRRLKLSFKSSVLINYDIGRGVLVIISRNQDDIIYAKTHEDIYLKCLDEKFHVSQMEKINQKLSIAESGGITAEFTIPENCLEGALGKHKINLHTAEKIPGIIVKVVKSSNKFIIQGETREAVNKARKLLEIKIEYLPIPTNIVGDLFGREGKNICSLKKASGILQIFVTKPEETPESVKVKENDILAIVGSSDAIEKAKLLITFKMGYIHGIRFRLAKKSVITEDTFANLIKTGNVLSISARLKNSEKQPISMTTCYTLSPDNKIITTEAQINSNEPEPNISLPIDGTQESFDFTYTSGDMDVGSENSTIIVADDKEDSVGRQQDICDLIDLFSKIE